MNLIVTSPQLRKLMTNYLNDFLSNREMVELDDELIIIRDNLGEYAEYDDEVIIEYDRINNNLYIRRDLLDNFIGWFPLDLKNSAHFIKNWFEGIAGVKVDSIKSSDKFYNRKLI